MKYKNCGLVERTFYGISIEPGQIKEFPGYINAKNFVRIFEDTPKEEKPKRTYNKKSKNSAEENQSSISVEEISSTTEPEVKDNVKESE